MLCHSKVIKNWCKKSCQLSQSVLQASMKTLARSKFFPNQHLQQFYFHQETCLIKAKYRRYALHLVHTRTRCIDAGKYQKRRAGLCRFYGQISHEPA